MLEWLLRPDSNPVVVFSAWTKLIVLALIVLLFIYTLSLRFLLMLTTRRRARIDRVWRDIVAAAAMSRDQAEAMPLPRVSGMHTRYLMEIWNRARDTVRGSAADNLIVLGQRLRLVEEACRLLDKRSIRSRVLATQTLGHMRHKDSLDVITELIDSPGMAISITAARALVEIDREKAARLLIPMISRRRDWPRTQVLRFLRALGSARISEELYRAIRSAEDEDRIYLLQFAQLAEHDVIHAICAELIRESNNPAVLAAALKLVSGDFQVPRLQALAQHPVWFVRMRIARLLGDVGQPEHVSLLEDMLDDPEWWVRYRAAQAIAKLPFLGPNALRQIRDRQQDRYAREMLEQAFSEVGIA